MLLGLPVLIAAVINPQVASFAHFPCIQLSIFVLTAGRQFHSSPLVVAIFAKSFRVELCIRVFALSYLTNLFPIGTLFDN